LFGATEHSTPGRGVCLICSHCNISSFYCSAADARPDSYNTLPLTYLQAIFSSKLLTSSTTEVLIAGRQCGLIANNGGLAFYAIVEKVLLYQMQRLIETFSYSSQCCGNQKSESCGKYAQPISTYTVDTNASCPLATDVCKSQSGKVVLDSGRIDSVHHLGLNAGPSFTFEFANHCASLSTEGYTNVITITDRNLTHLGSLRSTPIALRTTSPMSMLPRWIRAVGVSMAVLGVLTRCRKCILRPLGLRGPVASLAPPWRWPNSRHII
jgi:hypothetical protein